MNPQEWLENRQLLDERWKFPDICEDFCCEEVTDFAKLLLDSIKRLASEVATYVDAKQEVLCSIVANRILHDEQVATGETPKPGELEAGVGTGADPPAAEAAAVTAGDGAAHARDDGGDQVATGDGQVAGGDDQVAGVGAGELEAPAAAAAGEAAAEDAAVAAEDEAAGAVAAPVQPVVDATAEIGGDVGDKGRNVDNEMPQMEDDGDGGADDENSPLVPSNAQKPDNGDENGAGNGEENGEQKDGEQKEAALPVPDNNVEEDEEENDEEAEEDEQNRGQEKKGAGRPKGSKTTYAFSDEEIKQQFEKRFLILSDKWQNLASANSSDWLQQIEGRNVKLLLLDPFFDDTECYTQDSVGEMLLVAAPLMADSGVAVLMGKESPINCLIAHFLTGNGKKQLKKMGTILYYTILYYNII